MSDGQEQSQIAELKEQVERQDAIIKSTYDENDMLKTEYEGVITRKHILEGLESIQLKLQKLSTLDEMEYMEDHSREKEYYMGAVDAFKFVLGRKEKREMELTRR